jgi:ABC-type transport system involved in cytochrome bd biosynthesis fused ATPase/permease subunit
LRGQGKNKTRLLVTHRLSVLPQCDVVWRLEAGRLAVEVSE